MAKGASINFEISKKFREFLSINHKYGVLLCPNKFMKSRNDVELRRYRASTKLLSEADIRYFGKVCFSDLSI